MNIQVGSFNILHPGHATNHSQREGINPDGSSNWGTRKALVSNLIVNSGLDIISLQEVSQASLADLQADYAKAGFAAYGYGHNSGGDGVAILYNMNRFNFISQKSLLTNGRTALVMELYDKTTNKTIQVGNCHLLGGPPGSSGQLNGQAQVEALQNLMHSSATPVDLRIITGDFNSGENVYKDSVQGKIPSSKFTNLLANQYQTDCDINKQSIMPSGEAFDPLKHIPYSEDTVDKKTGPKKRKIDWIFARPTQPGSITVEENKSIFDYQLKLPLAVRASDHHLVATKIIFNNLPPIAPLAPIGLIAPLVKKPDVMAIGKAMVECNGLTNHAQAILYDLLQSYKTLESKLNGKKSKKIQASLSSLQNDLQTVGQLLLQTIKLRNDNDAFANKLDLPGLQNGKISAQEKLDQANALNTIVTKGMGDIEALLAANGGADDVDDSSIKKPIVNPSNTGGSKPINPSPSPSPSLSGGVKPTPANLSAKKPSFFRSISNFFGKIGKSIMNFFIRIAIWLGFKKK